MKLLDTILSWLATVFFLGIIAMLILSAVGCAADIRIQVPNDVDVTYKSARKAAISVAPDGTVTILTGEVITDDPAALVDALGKSVDPLK